ncbi:unnamed protein product [Clonostachys solani]|uniref:Uncharacterized protein n=1 Tax=Clonostachys solani TaxID=160281 RepID=A0A9N9Z1R3_9HYPO|nr:unnamed protein product [Clonostachys solani]
MPGNQLPTDLNGENPWLKDLCISMNSMGELGDMVILVHCGSELLTKHITIGTSLRTTYITPHILERGMEFSWDKWISCHIELQGRLMTQDGGRDEPPIGPFFWTKSKMRIP